MIPAGTRFFVRAGHEISVKKFTFVRKPKASTVGPLFSAQGGLNGRRIDSMYYHNMLYLQHITNDKACPPQKLRRRSKAGSVLRIVCPKPNNLDGMNIR